MCTEIGVNDGKENEKSRRLCERGRRLCDQREGWILEQDRRGNLT